MGIKIILRDCENSALLDKILQQLKTQGEQLMKTETEIKAAIASAVSQVKADIATAIAKEKAEVIEAIKALPAGGITDAALADLVASVQGIGASTVGEVDAISVDVTQPAPTV